MSYIIAFLHKERALRVKYLFGSLDSCVYRHLRHPRQLVIAGVIACLNLSPAQALAAGKHAPKKLLSSEDKNQKPEKTAAISRGEEQITVTVRRRSEPLQKVPVATSVFTAKEAARNNVHDLQGIFQFIPSANFRTSASSKDGTVFVRGIGTISTSPGVEPSVSTVLDGVVLARSGQATADLLDLEHIEVLGSGLITRT